MSFVSSAAERITRKLGWSNSAEAWTDRLGLLFAFVVIGGWLTISFWSGRPAVILVVGAVGVATLALLERIGVIKLLGPVFWYDTIRSARRGRYFLMRWLYAIGLLLLLLWVHSIWSLQNRFVNNADPNWNEFKALAQLAEQYFFAFAIVQFVAVVLLTPAYVGGAIAEEKERKTLEFLLATDLQNSEIDFGGLNTSDLFDTFNIGNPIFGMINVGQAFGARMIGYEEVMLDELKKYATWHGLVTAVSLSWAVLRLRAVALTQGGTSKRVRRGRRIVQRPPVGQRPMMWKEV